MIQNSLWLIQEQIFHGKYDLSECQNLAILDLMFLEHISTLKKTLLLLVLSPSVMVTFISKLLIHTIVSIEAVDIFIWFIKTVFPTIQQKISHSSSNVDQTTLENSSNNKNHNTKLLKLSPEHAQQALSQLLRHRWTLVITRSLLEMAMVSLQVPLMLTTRWKLLVHLQILLVLVVVLQLHLSVLVSLKIPKPCSVVRNSLSLGTMQHLNQVITKKLFS